MHGSFRTEKMNSEFARTDGKLHVDNDSNHGDRRKSDPKRSRTKGKSAYSSARKLKESHYAYS